MEPQLQILRFAHTHPPPPPPVGWARDAPEQQCRLIDTLITVN